jgi:hypothetical protein
MEHFAFAGLKAPFCGKLCNGWAVMVQPKNWMWK